MMSARVPRYLHQPVQILWFDPEDIAVIMVCYLLWMIVDSWYVLPVAVLLPYLFINTKASRPRGFLRHFLYYWGFNDLKGYPQPQTREFHE